MQSGLQRAEQLVSETKRPTLWVSMNFCRESSYDPHLQQAVLFIKVVMARLKENAQHEIRKQLQSTRLFNHLVLCRVSL